MPELGQEDFSLGWIPSDSPLTGRPNGFLRMDNLQLDELGSVEITRASERVGDLTTNFPGETALKVFSREISGVKHRYIHLDSGKVAKDNGETANYTELFDGGSATDAAFGYGNGQVLIATGTKKKKDTGSELRDLGIEIPQDPPTVTIEEPDILEVQGDFGNWEILEGHSKNLLDGPEVPPSFVSVSDLGLSFRPVYSTGRAVIQNRQTVDTTFFNGSSGNESPLDTFRMNIISFTKLNSVVIEFFLEDPGTNVNTVVDNKYFIVFSSGPGFLASTFNVTSFNPDSFNPVFPLTAQRKDFTRSGTDPDLNWSNVRAIRITINANPTSAQISIRKLTFSGGADSFTGTYQWIQANVYNNGDYIAVSPIGPPTEEIELKNQRVKIDPAVPIGLIDTPQSVNEIWIFRREVFTFDTYYRIAIREDVSQFADTIDDLTAIGKINIPRNDDDRTIEAKAVDFFIEHPPDNIIAIEGLYFTRYIYLTKDKIYISHANNPDAVDPRYTLDVSADKVEENLWVKKVSDSQLYIGTTKDIYELSGTGRTQEDGTIDFLLRPLSVSHPPVSRAATVYNGSVIYVANDGWRVLSGADGLSITGGTNLLYNKTRRVGFAPVDVQSGNKTLFDCTVSHAKLFCVVPLTDSSPERWIFVYDLERRYWYTYKHDPRSIFTEEDGTLLAAFDSEIKILDKGSGSQTIQLRSPFIHGGLPRNRKDAQTLKIKADTQGELVQVRLYPDGSDAFQILGNYSFAGPTEVTVDISNNPQLNLEKSWSIEFVKVGISNFKLFWWNINYDPRPEQRNHLRVPPTNFGVAGRKRFYDLPFSIDSLGNGVTVSPVLDGAIQPGTFFPGSNLGKQFRSIAFPRETIGHELGIDIQSQGDSVFEFYEMIQPRHTELLPDLQKFLHIPYDNLGTPARKRFVRYAFIIDTRGNDLVFTPIIDDVEWPPMDIRTDRKQTVIYFFDSLAEGTDIGGRIEGAKEFEFYGIDKDETHSEVLPAPTTFLFACTDFGTAARKRFSRISFVCNPRGATLGFTPQLDGVDQPEVTFFGFRKQTFNYFFREDKKFVDLCYTVRSIGGDPPFEFYEILRPERLEILPEPVKFFHIPKTNLNSDKRKRFVAFAFVIDTLGAPVTFTPNVDGVNLTPSTVITTGKRTYIHYFTEETIGTDIGGTLDGPEAHEFYGINFDETISETLPGPAKYLVVPATNFGIAARKRVRTMPFVIHTRGGLVRFTPKIDGVLGVPSEFSTVEKRTVLHYYQTDVFGIDFGGIVESLSDTAFEFYNFETPENVQTLPVAKKFDQVGPIELNRAGWLRRIRVRLVPTGTLFSWEIFSEDTSLDSGSLTTTPDKETVLDISLAKGVKGTIFRIEFSSNDPFHRYDVEVWHNISGAETDLKRTILSSDRFEQPINRRVN